MSDEEGRQLKTYIEVCASIEGDSAAHEDARTNLDRILSDRDSLRAALERIANHERVTEAYGGPLPGPDATSVQYVMTLTAAEIARQALTSSEKDRCPTCGNPDRSFIECMDPFHPVTSSEKDRGPMVMQQLQQTTSSDATLRGTSSEKEKADG